MNMYDAKFRAKVLKSVRGGMSQAAAAKKYKLAEATIRSWREQDKTKDPYFTKSGPGISKKLTAKRKTYPATSYTKGIREKLAVAEELRVENAKLKKIVTRMTSDLLVPSLIERMLKDL
jgi:transposase